MFSEMFCTVILCVVLVINFLIFCTNSYCWHYLHEILL